MFVKVKQTRHTGIGTLRSGTILDVDQLGTKGQSVIAALLKQEKPALVKLSKKQVEAERDSVVSLVAVDDPVEETNIDQGVLEDLEGSLKEAATLNAKLQADLTAMIADRDGQAETAKSEAERADKAQAFAKDETKRADVAENAAKTLKADLNKAKKALTDVTKKSDGDGK